MRVLDDDERRCGSLEIVDEAAYEAVTVFDHGNVELRRDFEQRTECAGRDECVAASEADADGGADILCKRRDQRRLADPRLATDEHHSAVSRLRLPEPLAQQTELMIALEE